MKITVVGIGPGNRAEITPRALRAVEESQVVVGYGPYLEQIGHLLEGKTVLESGMKGEVERCRAAVEHAAQGEAVCVVSGGDAGVYGMAGLVHQLAVPRGLQVEVVPGVTAATAAAAALGAPLGHDFAVVSLSDLLTDWQLIERRLVAAAQGDFIICLYNPASRARAGHLRRACGILLEHKLPETPCGLARNVGRKGESVRILTLKELEGVRVDMFTTVLVGSSRTQVLGGRLVTPRGYAAQEMEAGT